MGLRFFCVQGERETVLRVSPVALDRAFRATNPEQYKHDDWRIARLLDLPENTRVGAPQIGVYEGRLGFVNGRHRALVAKLQGLKVIPVLVRKDNVLETREMLAKYRAASSADAQQSRRVLTDHRAADTGEELE
jgi:hypothetical protein